LDEKRRKGGYLYTFSQKQWIKVNIFKQDKSLTSYFTAYRKTAVLPTPHWKSNKSLSCSFGWLFKSNGL